MRAVQRKLASIALRQPSQRHMSTMTVFDRSKFGMFCFLKQIIDGLNMLDAFHKVDEDDWNQFVANKVN